MIATLLKQKLQDWCFLWLFQILNNTYFVEPLRMAVSEKQMNYRFNMKMVLLKTLLTIYPKNDKQNIVIKVCKISTHATHTLFLTHATNAKISTHATHAKILWTHAAHATHAKIWPTPPTHPRYPRDPRDLADSFETYNIPFYWSVIISYLLKCVTSLASMNIME